MLNLNKRTDEGNVYHKYRFRYCTRQDFESRGVKIDAAFEETINRRLCPDVPDDETFYQVMGSYSNATMRHSFSVDIIKCLNTTQTCSKTDTEVENILKQIYFTVFTV